MYTYIVKYFNYEDTENRIVFHSKNFSSEEFKRMCDEAVEYLRRIKGEHYYEDSGEIVRYLVDNKGFVNADNKVLMYELGNNEVEVYKYMI